MLIDSTHKRWFLVTVLLAVVFGGAWAYAHVTKPGGETGGSFVGLWYGVIGSGLMVFAGLLSALRKVPAWWWLGPRKTWLRGHIWLGLLSVLFIFCHSGMRVGGPLTLALWVVFLLVIVTGIFGLALQQFMPRQITTRVPCEAPYEQIPHLCLRMRKKAEDLVAELNKKTEKGVEMSIQISQHGQRAVVQFYDFYAKRVLPFLQEDYPRGSVLANAAKAEAAFDQLKALPGLQEVRDQVTGLEELCNERRLLAEQERLHFWLHGWLAVHIPLSVALLVLSVTHIVSALYY